MKILLTGDYRHREFRDAVAWLTDRCESDISDDLDTALVRLYNSDDPPQVIVVAQSHPGQFSQIDVERLHRAAPLARMIALLGSWCEGEARSSRPWPGVYRVFWHEWASFWTRTLSASQGGIPYLFSLPRTASSVEHCLHLEAPARATHSGLIGIHTNSFTAFDALADACATGGYSAVWLSEVEGKYVRQIKAIIWDSHLWQSAAVDQLRRLISTCDPIPVLATISFPRLSDIEQLRSIGVASVLAKPFSLGNLHSELNRLVRSGLQNSILPRENISM